MRAMVVTARLLLRELEPGDVNALSEALGDVDALRDGPAPFPAAKRRPSCATG